jgi:hypothetical protein
MKPGCCFCLNLLEIFDFIMIPLQSNLLNVHLHGLFIRTFLHCILQCISLTQFTGLQNWIVLHLRAENAI